MDYDDKQIFYVFSKNRISGDSNSFLYQFDINPGDQYDSVAVLGATIPKSFYLINSFNDEFILTEDTTSVTITITHGNYTLASWRNTLTNALNANSPNGWVYTVSYPSTTATDGNNGKLTFTVSGNTSQPSFTFSERLYLQMGFNANVTYQFTANTLTSVNVINLQLLAAVFIHSDVCNNKSDSVLQEIYVNDNDYSSIRYQASAAGAYGKKISGRSNQVCRFYLTDEYSQLVNLNGLEWSFTIIFYKQNNTLDMIKNYIKLSLLQ